MAISKSESKS
jgi:hypothetical protein